VLGWCAGRYLFPGWLAFLIYAWSLALLDLLTIIACMAGPLHREFAYAVLATQCCALAIWSTLADTGWQNRFPAALGASSIVILFAGFWQNEEWSVLLIVTVTVVAALGMTFRFVGIRIARDIPADAGRNASNHGQHQFGIRHILMWAAAMSPFLIMTKGANYRVLLTFLSYGLLLAVVISTCIAITAFIAVWALLSSRRRLLRLLVAIVSIAAVPFILDGSVSALFATGMLPKYRGYWPNDAIVGAYHDIRNQIYVWYAILGGMTAALFMFLLGQNYRLVRSRDRSESAASPARI
jgi:hypothetical protein